MDYSMDNHKKLTLVAGFLFCLINILVLHAIAKVTVYPYDAGVYWRMGGEFGFDHFRFRNYGESLRGYIYPLFCYIMQKLSYEGIGNEYFNFRVISGILYASLFALILPGTLERMFRFQQPDI